MSTKIRVPSECEDLSEIRVSRLRVSPGEQVRKGQVLCDLETNKASISIRAPSAGVIKTVLAEADHIVQSGTVLIEMEAETTSSSSEPCNTTDDPSSRSVHTYTMLDRRTLVVNGSDRIAIQLLSRSIAGLGFDSFVHSDTPKNAISEGKKCILDKDVAGFAIVTLTSNELLPLKEVDKSNIFLRIRVQPAIMEYLMHEISHTENWIAMEDTEHANPNIKHPMGFTGASDDDNQQNGPPHAPPQWLLAELIRSLAQERRQIIESALSAKDKIALLEQNRKAITISTGGTVAKTDYIVYAILVFGAVVLIVLSLLTAFAGLTPEVTISFVGTVLGGVIATIAQKLGKI